MLASSLDSAKNGGGEGQTRKRGRRCSSQGNGLQTCEAAEEACKRPNEIYIPVCVCIESLPSRVAKLCTEREERNMHKFAV